MKTIAIFLLMILGAACSSSSAPSSSSPACDFVGAYTVNYLTSSGTCGAIPTGSATFTQSGSSFVAPVPAGAAVTPGGSFDEGSCVASFGWTTPTDGLCSSSENVAAYDLTFTSTGFSGTLTLTGCAAAEDGGAGVPCSGTYAVSAARE